MTLQSSRDQKESSLGILNLFSLIEEPVKQFETPPQISHPSTDAQIFQREKELLGFYLTGHPMGQYQKLLKKLSCVPLGEFDKMPPQAVIRASFIINSIQIKVSSKNQKKFAILSVGDGLEQFEMPVWPELFEEKMALIKENQLLYAILQLDRKEGNLQLSCKYLEDLTAIDEEKMKHCDTLFDQLKMQARTGEPKWKKEKEKKVGKDEKEEVVKHLVLPMNAERLKLSDLLSLKKLFRDHPGKSTVEIQFLSGEKKIGILSIDEQWGVKAEAPFLEKLEAFKKSL